MKPLFLIAGLWCLGLAFNTASASSGTSRPTCVEKPEQRDCVKVEDPDATSPKPSVYRQKKPTHPIAKPRPAKGGATAR